MFKKGFVVTIIFLVSTLIQLVSQILVTRLYGAYMSLELFLAAVSIPTLIVTVIYAACNDAFLPIYAQYKSDTHERDIFFSRFISWISVISCIVTVLLIISALPFARYFFAGRDDQFIHEVSFQMKLLYMSIPFAVFTTILGSTWYAKGDMIRFPLAQAIGSVANIILIVFLRPYIDSRALIAAFVLNIAAQMIVVWPKNLRLSLGRVDIKPFCYAFIPLAVASICMRTDMLLIRSYGTSLPSGYLVYLNLISKICSLATGVLTIGIQVVLLPHLVTELRQHKIHTVLQMVARAKLMAILISGIVIGGIMLIGPPIIRILFIGGKFTQQDADITISLLPYFILPALGWGVNNVFFQPLIALKKTKLVLAINIGAVLLGWGGAQVFTHLYGALYGIIYGLTLLLFSGIAGSEIAWQQIKKNLS